MADAWEVLVDLATVLAGVAAAIAIWLTLRQQQAVAAERERDLANRVIAWAVTEGLDPGTDPGGVIIANDTSLALVDVDVRTQRRNDADDLEDDDFAGRRFSLVPPGTYYLQQLAPAGAAGGVPRWSAPIPVETGGGQFVVTPPPLPARSSGEPAPADASATAPVTLVPVTMRPEGKRVAFLRFTLAGTTWHRSVDAALHRSRGPATWDEEFRTSEREPLTPPVRRTWDHSAHDGVVAFYRELYTYLTGEAPASSGPSTAPVKSPLADVLRSVQLTTKQQAIRLYLVDCEGFGWCAGTGKGDVVAELKLPPATPEGRDRHVKDASGRSLRRPVADVADPTARTAFFEELVTALRRTAATGSR